MPNNVYFKSLSYTNVLFKLEMNAQQNKIFWIETSLLKTSLGHSGGV
jgi:hypothetical protein